MYASYPFTLLVLVVQFFFDPYALYLFNGVIPC